MIFVELMNCTGISGEKHKWIANRVENLLPVQYEPQEMVIVQKVNKFEAIHLTKY